MMNKVSYEIRTKRGKPVFVYDNLASAKRGKIESEKRIGIQLDIYEVKTVERCLAV